jgi:hypothetical protein
VSEVKCCTDMWLMIYCFTYLKIFHLYGGVTIGGERLQNLGLYSAPSILIRKGSLSCYTCCDTGPLFFQSHTKDRHI